MVTLLALALTAPAWADVVRLNNGREIRGKVVREDSQGVVVETRQGKVTLPPDLVASIERESASQNLLVKARQALRDGDHAAATRLLDEAEARARADDEPVTLAEISQARAALRATGEGPTRRRRDAAREAWSGEGDPFRFAEEQALIRELAASAEAQPELRRRLVFELYKRGGQRHDQGQHRRAVSDFEQAAEFAGGDDVANLLSHAHRCRLEVAEQALRDDAWELTCAATLPLVEAGASTRSSRRAAYLAGRALELLGEHETSRDMFLRCLEGTPVPRERELATLRELARLHSVGVAIGADTPGVGEGWRWLETRHFAILHQLEEGGSLGRDVETAHRDVVQRLKLGRLDDRGRIALFLFASREGYHETAASRSWMAGHAQRVRTDDELIRAIYLFPGEGFAARLRHEIAHILVGDSLDDAVIPAWGNEGVAVYAEGDASLGRYTRAAAWHRAQGRWVSTEEFVTRMLVPNGETVEIQAFYAQAAVTFDQLQRRSGVRRVLSALTHVDHDGAGALRRVNTRLDQLERGVGEALDQEIPR